MNQENDILWLVRKIIYHDPTQNYIFKSNTEDKNLIPKNKSLFFSGGKGLPIGNLTSQFFANVYLDCLDHFIINDLEARQYLRYVDDVLILEENKNRLVNYIKPIQYFLENKLKLELKKNKTILQPIRHGIDFLGYFIKLNYSLVRQKIVKRLKKKLIFLAKSDNVERKELKNILARINSYYGHFCHASSFNLRKHIYNKHLKEFKNNFIPQEDYTSLKLLTPVV